MTKQESTPILRQFHDLKQKHPDAVLLFRGGDFYETYEQDAKVVSEVLGITLTKRTGSPKGEGYMAGFPYHALDSYLPKIIRAGHRVAICDIPEPTTKLVRRGSDELTTTDTNNSTDNNSKSQETMQLNLSNTESENQNVQNAQVTNPTTAIVPATPAQDIVDADFEEVKPEPVAEEKPKKKTTIKRKVTLKKKQVISEAQPAQVFTPIPTREGQGEGLLPQVQFSTYTTKRGDVAPQIIGFGGEDDPRWKSHKDAGHKYVSASYRRDLNGNKVYILLFGTRYMDVAKALAGAYNTNDVNAWHRAEDACMAIYEQAQRDGKARWEEKKAQWAEKKNEERRVKNEEFRAAESAEKQVAAMLEKLMKGEDVPESILKHIDPEVLAKFTKAE